MTADFDLAVVGYVLAEQVKDDLQRCQSFLLQTDQRFFTGFNACTPIFNKSFIFILVILALRGGEQDDRVAAVAKNQHLYIKPKVLGIPTVIFFYQIVLTYFYECKIGNNLIYK